MTATQSNQPSSILQVKFDDLISKLSTLRELGAFFASTGEYALPGAVIQHYYDLCFVLVEEIEALSRSSN